MKCVVKLTTMLIVLVVMIQTAAAHGINYNLKNDWSDMQNPNGPWTLNIGSTAMTNHMYRYYSESNVWDVDGSSNPSWAKTYVTGGWNDRQSGDIIAQAWWFGSTKTNVTWTSPGDGLIDISGKNWDAYGGNRDGGWSLDINGVTFAQRVGILNLKRDQYGASFADNLLAGKSLSGIPVQAGDVVMFSVNGISTSGVDINIKFTSTVELNENVDACRQLCISNPALCN